MKISARVRGEWLQVPCKEGKLSIGWLGSEALRRYQKLQGNNKAVDDNVQEIRKTKGGAILDFDDLIKDVLDDNDFISIVLASDRSCPVAIPENFDNNIDHSFLFLDGSSLSTDDLLQLGRCRYKIKLTHEAEQGSVGASGDLAPLAHLALGLLGEGKMWSPETGWGEAKCLITSLGAEAVERAALIARQADVVAALTLEVLKGTSRAFDSDVQMIRPHKGQIAVAKRLRALLHSDTYPSQIAESHRFCNRVQDAYTLRCCPQVHGIVHDTIDFVQGVITVEMNSATDNPIVFANRGEIISAGNFHGEYPAKVLDYLAIAVHELASMSERRTERLVNPALSELPAFLVKDGGLNSGFMLAHCTAAALVSENKVLCHPSSVDSLSTSAGTEDHVSMGCFAARKALNVVENVERVIAIELLAACQAIEFLRPLKTTVPLEEVYKLVRSVVSPWDKDRVMAPDINAVTNLLVEGKIWAAVRHHMDFYLAPQL
ncbi:hypothetical protein B566_EDAN001589 [Ephemera danica]|nr:hypothetical protein B566_EDAN001589 [Ephemera danica]